MKSALELAMERANASLGDQKIQLTAQQKEAIEEVKRTYQAKLAEQEIALQAKLNDMDLQADPRHRAEAHRQVEQELNRLRETYNAERDAKIQAIRDGQSA